MDRQDGPTVNDAEPPAKSDRDPFDIRQRQRLKSGRTVIAHISDLHLQLDTQTDGGDWAALRSSLEKRKGRVDLLIATGDLVELPKLKVPKAAFLKARKYLERLCQALEIGAEESLLVVPGNHDLRELRGLGWFRRRALEDFQEVFKDQMPMCRHYPNLKACLFCFDSNPRGWFPDFAAGFVQQEELVHFADLARKVGNVTATKIALVHHHPMPIGPTQRSPHKLIGGEPYMLLKNSGIFMQEMARADIDLVLHGHRHYPAISRVLFRGGDRQDRQLLVVAAGSVGNADDHDLSYQLITIEDSGEITLERFRLREATYQLESKDQLISYEVARQRRISRRAERFGARLRIEKYVCHWNIQPGSGDVQATWTVKDASTDGEPPVASIPTEFTSRTGYIGVPKYETYGDQSVRFERDEPNKGRVVFDPPIDSSPVTYKGQMMMRNAFHFNRQDRRAATDDTSDRESVAVIVEQLIHSLALSVTFPEEHLPRSFSVDAWRVERSQSGGWKIDKDARESRYAGPSLVKLDTGRTVTLFLREPLPFYRYGIEWELPETEVQERPLPASAQQRTQEIRQRLEQTKYARTIEDCLEGLRKEIAGTEPADAALFVYRESARGLISVAAVGDSSFKQGLQHKIVKVGRTLVGQAYRRREHLGYVSTASGSASEFYFDRETDQATVLHDGRTAIFSMPVVYPLESESSQGLRVAVLWLGTKSRLSDLIRLHGDSGFRDSLFDLVAVWFKERLLPAIELGDLDVFRSD